MMGGSGGLVSFSFSLFHNCYWSCLVYSTGTFARIGLDTRRRSLFCGGLGEAL